MAWIFLAESEESVLHSENGCDQSHTAKSTDIVKECSSAGWQMDYSTGLRSGTTYALYNPSNLEPLLTLSMEDFHARISVLQDMEKAWQESVRDCFTRSLGCVATLSPDSSFWRTCQLSLLEAEPKWLEPLPRWGMVVDGALYPLNPSGHYIDENDGSCWPTPQARDYKDSGHSNGSKKRKNPNLPAAIMMATPTASQANKPIRKPSPSRQKGEHGEDLQDSIGRLNPENIGKKLCPQWVSVLMGYPKEYTDLKPWGIAWFLNKQKKHSKS